MPSAPKADALMELAVALSRRGFPAPNPHVGCVIVSGGEVVGKGFHAFAGGPHAEVVALRQAGSRARGADVYVTLEPCNHHGRTPPCTEALIDAEVRRVFVAVRDPNPRAAGGLEHLQSAGIDVSVGLDAALAAAANRRWLDAHELGRPYVGIKIASSLDAKVALASGESKWITGDAARTLGRRLRALYGAILVGSGTVLADDPQLTARRRDVRREPTKILLDGSRSLNGTERAFLGEPPIWMVPEPAKPGQTGLSGENGVFEPKAVLELLWRMGITQVLIEGGPATIGHFLRAGLVDEVHQFWGPLVMGPGRLAYEMSQIERLAEARRWRLAELRRLGDDVYARYLCRGA